MTNVLVSFSCSYSDGVPAGPCLICGIQREPPCVLHSFDNAWKHLCVTVNVSVHMPGSDSQIYGLVNKTNIIKGRVHLNIKILSSFTGRYQYFNIGNPLIIGKLQSQINHLLMVHITDGGINKILWLWIEACTSCAGLRENNVMFHIILQHWPCATNITF